MVETVEGNLGQGMRQLNGVYTQQLNRRHGRVGHVFQGRYRAILIEKDAYLLELMRYVMLNPVRAKLMADPEEWPWSSYRAMAGKACPPEWLPADWVLSQFGTCRKKAIAGYVDFVRAGVGGVCLWKSFRGQIFLGSDAFIEDLQEMAASRRTVSEIPRMQRRPLARPLAEYRETIADPRTAMVEAYATGDYTLKEIAACFGVHSSIVSRAVKRVGR